MLRGRPTSEVKDKYGTPVPIRKTNPETTYMIAFPNVQDVTLDKLFKGKILSWKDADETPSLSGSSPLTLTVEVVEMPKDPDQNGKTLTWERVPDGLPIYNLPASAGRRKRSRSTRRRPRRRQTNKRKRFT